MYYGKIDASDIANGPGVRVTLFVSGCRNHCKGCFQPETWAFDYGQEYTKETEDKIIELLRPDHIQGLTILGGDPFEPENYPVVADLCQRVFEEFQGRKNIWIYSGYTIDNIVDKYPDLKVLDNCDVLVDGPFKEEEFQLGLTYRGSRNQRIIDLTHTTYIMKEPGKPLPSKKIMLWKDGEYK